MDNDDGSTVGILLGSEDADGCSVGCPDGELLGSDDGCALGVLLGADDGCALGALLGSDDGCALGALLRAGVTTQAAPESSLASANVTSV